MGLWSQGLVCLGDSKWGDRDPGAAREAERPQLPGAYMDTYGHVWINFALMDLHPALPERREEQDKIFGAVFM